MAGREPNVGAVDSRLGTPGVIVESNDKMSLWIFNLIQNLDTRCWVNVLRYP